jgi:hypothetical protein
MGVTDILFVFFVSLFWDFLEIGRRKKKNIIIMPVKTLVGLISSVVNIYSLTFSIELFLRNRFAFIIAIVGMGYRFAINKKNLPRSFYLHALDSFFLFQLLSYFL